ncbi:DASH family cryptochrome [Salinimonas marina]|uniref:Cryptochrome DASH n=1 Tax=Salinimonas marina TaxID=2785918 RepID=A0A7S9HEV1_9ALTE|nr:DASH family cryptochrome [Salinimonas marina]QPG07051.1 DASH family cryptochrome [Salinimonas marina]
MSGTYTTGLYWFTRDLRLDDMPALYELNQHVDRLILVYCKQPSWFCQNRFGLSSMGAHRWRFIEQGLADLHQQLGYCQQSLLVFDQEPETVIPNLCIQYAITHVGTSRCAGVYEHRSLATLQNKLSDCSWFIGSAVSMFNESDLPEPVAQMKDSFTPWRKAIEGVLCAEPPVAYKTSLKAPPATLLKADACSIAQAHPSPVNQESWYGGERAGLNQLHHYFYATHNIARYKETRNGLLGWDYSSKFSAWLAQGMLSPRRIIQHINEYETQHTKNNSTYWLYFELLWREFFYWQLQKHGALFFAAGGFKTPHGFGEFDEKAFENWCRGHTGCLIVDAAMRELAHTGFTSNRTRQLCASYLIHELNLPWRYGAAWFEHQLIDYDVASNWGNWLYLAGKGNDPRQQRKFDMQQQTQAYDPEHRFINRWLSK